MHVGLQLVGCLAWLKIGRLALGVGLLFAVALALVGGLRNLVGDDKLVMVVA